MIFEQVWERYGNAEAFIKDHVLPVMEAQGIKQSALAQRAGFHPSHVSSWLRFKVKPSMETLVKLDEALFQLVTDGGHTE